MILKRSYDAVIVGSGPNGLAAAISLAQVKKSVLLLESQKILGGGMRSAELTLPGFIHDVCSAIHPLGAGSPFFSTLPLKNYGLEWIHPYAPLAHPFEDGSAVILERSIESTCQTLGQDAQSYKSFMDPMVEIWPLIASDVLGPFKIPSHPIAMSRFALKAIRSAQHINNRYFNGRYAKGLFAGLAAHSIMPLDRPLTAGIGIILGVLAHHIGWPLARGGSQSIADALSAYFTALGGTIQTGIDIEHIDQIPQANAILFDLSPRSMLKIAGNRFPQSYRRRLEKYRYGPGIFKIDWALDCPIPWKSKECLRAGTVHVGGEEADIVRSEQEVWSGIHPEKSFMIVAQQSLFDTSRVPGNKQTAWAYCHVPSGSTVNMTERLEAQMERFAPGFRDCILARSIKTALEIERYNPNYVGGDISGGVVDLRQLFARPAGWLDPYSTPTKGIYICSASTPPGGGVHGMCGYHAARMIR